MKQFWGELLASDGANINLEPNAVKVKRKKKMNINNKLKKAEKELKRMESNNMDAEVITAQKKFIDRLKQEQEDENNQKILRKGEYNKDALLKFKIVDDETYQVSQKEYKVAFVKNNRPIDNNKVDGFISIIAGGKYENAFPIIAVLAKEAISNGYEVKDAKGDIITNENAEQYLVILDGQHRTMAFLRSTITTKDVSVPNTHLRSATNIGEYLVDINDVGTSWSQRDRLAVAALVVNDELVQEMADRISEGFNPTTAALLYTGKKIGAKSVKQILRGEKLNLPQGARLDIPRGNKFVQLCKEAKISVKFITKRYFINGFNSFSASTNEITAFEQLGKLKNLNLTEEKLTAVKSEIDFIEILRTAA